MGTSSQVTINATQWWVYGTAAGFDAYAGASLGPIGVAWLAADATKRLKGMLEATRLLEQAAWQGQKSVSTQPLALPRTGLTRRDGTQVDATTIPDEVEFASYALAGLILADPSVLAAATSGSNVKAVGAGPAHVEFFRPQLGVTGRWPTQVANLINQFLGLDSDSVSGSDASGVCEESTFDDSDAYRISRSI